MPLILLSCIVVNPPPCQDSCHCPPPLTAVACPLCHFVIQLSPLASHCCSPPLPLHICWLLFHCCCRQRFHCSSATDCSCLSVAMPLLLFYPLCLVSRRCPQPHPTIIACLPLRISWLLFVVVVTVLSCCPPFLPWMLGRTFSWGGTTLTNMQVEWFLSRWWLLKPTSRERMKTVMPWLLEEIIVGFMFFPLL